MPDYQRLELMTETPCEDLESLAVEAAASTYLALLDKTYRGAHEA
jgi:hypothetical protein